MSQQPLDLRRSVHIIRRHKILVGSIAAAGVLLGVAYGLLQPVMVSSSALVVLPPNAPPVATEVVIADSDPVLIGALPHIQPPVSLSTLEGDVEASTVTSGIITIVAHGKDAAQAGAIANAVANSYVGYVGEPNSPVGHVAARVLEPATGATGTDHLKKLIIDAIIGMIVGLVIGFIIALGASRNDRRLRERDEIANSIGMPVLASVPVDHPVDTAGWGRLLEEYQPGVVHAWRLRKALQFLGAGDGHSSIMVLSLSSDPGALALGPQLAIFAASLGITTTLFVGPQQDANAVAALRAACAVAPKVSSELSPNLRTVVSDDDSPRLDTSLTVVVAVIDPRNPRIPPTARTNTAVLGVSAGKATGEQLARAAVAAASDGREIVGIVVADPESIDRTTGQIPYLGRPMRRRLPTRLVGVTTEDRP
jgi:hypothetical protein